MRKAIAALKKVGHIRQIHDGRWLFKAVLTAKPHQDRGCTGEFGNKLISPKYIFGELNVVDMECCINSHLEKIKKNHGIPSVMSHNTFFFFLLTKHPN